MNVKESGFALALLAALLVVVVNVAQAQLIPSIANSDQQRLVSLVKAMQEVSLDKKHKITLRQEMKSSVGRGFWSECFKRRLLEPYYSNNVVSQGPAGDNKASVESVAEEGLTQGQCSFTSPKGGELLASMELKGNNRAVLFCFDSRNWNNYPKKGVLVAWSQGEVEYLSPESANERYSISADEWKDPAKSILGTKKPFHRTWQEAECSEFKNAEVQEQDDIDYSAVYRKKGRVIEFSATIERDGKTETVILRCTVKDLTDTQATVLREALDEQGVAKGKNNANEEVIDITDKTCAKPPRGNRVKGSETEIEAAGRKWRAEKWTGKFSGTEESALWMSTEIPGLIIKAETKSIGSVIMLREFKDPEEK